MIIEKECRVGIAHQFDNGVQCTPYRGGCGGFTLAEVTTGGSVKRSLAMAIPKAFGPSVSLRAGFEAATQRSTSDARRYTNDEL